MAERPARRRGKLGGILIELRAESGGPAHVVIGVASNLRLGMGELEAVAATGTRAADLATAGLDTADRTRSPRP